MAGWDDAGQVYGTAGTQEEWATLLTNNPRVLWGLVADVVKAVKAGEGGRKTGRRPAVAVGSLDELYEVLFPTVYQQDPFPQAFAAALGRRSQRAFAQQIGFNQATISRLLAGKTAPTVEMIERIAHTLNVRPTYFHEYRAMKIGQVVTDVLLAHPTLSADAVRRLAGVSA
jgi:DNA-binding XRE family transcriptional regulator